MGLAEVLSQHKPRKRSYSRRKFLGGVVQQQNQYDQGITEAATMASLTGGITVAAQQHLTTAIVVIPLSGTAASAWSGSNASSAPVVTDGELPRTTTSSPTTTIANVTVG